MERWERKWSRDIHLGKREGHKYEGEWKDGKEHGQGTWTWSNGQKDVGEFRGNKHWNTTSYDKNGNILGK